MTPTSAIYFEALHARICPAQVMGRSRSRGIAHIRHRAILRAYLSGYSVSEIGRELGRDHTTICAAIKAIRR